MLFKISRAFVVVSVTVVVLFACGKNFLDTSPRGVLDEGTLSDVKGLNNLLIGAYALLDNYDQAIEFNQFGASASNALFGDIGGTVANKGSEFGDQCDIYCPIERHEVTSLNKALNDQWRVLYEGIKRTNQVLRISARITDLDETTRKSIDGQARFLRGWYHFTGRIIFKKFAYIDVVDDDKIISGEIVAVPNEDEIFPKIVDDAKYAYENLPETQDARGRINKWVAGAFYGKVLLYTGDYATARTVLNDVVDNGKTPLGAKFDLVPNYGDNFDVSQENSVESVFAFQASSNDNGGGGNANWGDMLNTPQNAGGGAGFFTPTYYFVNHYKTTASGLPVANPQSTQVIDPYGQPGFTEYAGPLDPRLDWTIGRKGIPYHDWGMVDDTWIRPDPGVTAPFSSGPYHPKKGTIRNSQVQGSRDAGVWFETGGVSLNINLIRFADVLLMAAEAEAEAAGGSLAKAFEYVNRVRTRAANSAKVKTYINPANPTGGFTNTDADTYAVAPYPAVFASKAEAVAAIRLERLLELGMEGFRFFDLVRWGIAQTEINAFYNYESQLPYARVLKSPTAVPNYASPGDDYYPVPQAQIDLSNGILKQ